MNAFESTIGEINNKCTTILEQQSTILQYLSREYGPLPQPTKEVTQAHTNNVPCFLHL